MRKLIFWGTGNNAEALYKEFEDNKKYSGDTILAFCDSDTGKHGKAFHGIEIISPFELSDFKFDCLIIASSYEAEIRETIAERGLCSPLMIRSYIEYRDELYAQKQYYRRYGHIHKKPCADLGDMSLVVYTAIIGDYDTLKEPDYVDSHIKYICITDQSGIKSNVWEILKISNSEISPSILARRIKMLPWEFIDIKENIKLFWVDAKYKIIGDLRSYLSEYSGRSGMLFFPHPNRKCICDELSELIRLRKGERTEIIRQVAAYLSAGFPLDFGLYETACFYRNLSDSVVVDIMLEWWNEIDSRSVRDQLSLPYVLWKAGIDVDVCDLNIRRNPWIKNAGHKY